MVKILDWNPDKTDKQLGKIVFGILTTLFIGVPLYYQLIPYGPHDEIVKVSLIVGGIAAIGIQVAIHRLSSRRQEKYV